jgi:hypothetical protein
MLQNLQTLDARGYVMFLTLEKEARYAGLIVNQSKTKHMKTSRGKDKITQQYIIEQN